MKMFLVVALSFCFQNLAYAEVKQVQIQCVLMDEILQAQFNSTALLTVQSDNTVSGQVVFATKNLTQAPGLITHEPVQVTGTLKVFAAGEMYVGETDNYQLTTVDGSSDKVYFSMNTGNGDHFSSEMVVNSEARYISNCQYLVVPPPSAQK
jgi:hypothetical protein